MKDTQELAIHMAIMADNIGDERASTLKIMFHSYHQLNEIDQFDFGFQSREENVVFR